MDTSTKKLDECINSQRSPIIKIGLGFVEDQSKEATCSKIVNSLQKVDERKHRKYIKALMNSTKGNEEEIKKKAIIPPKSYSPTKATWDYYRRPLYQRHPYMTRSHYSFNGYRFSCNKFGHIAMNCRTCANNTPSFTRTNFNSFSPLIDFDILLQVRNFRHATHFCRTIFVESL